MHEKPKLQCTRDYSIFKPHDFNRPLHDDPRLLTSMKLHGFMPSSAIQCERNGGGTLKVIRGHHRLDCAKQLKIPVWYIVDESNTDIFDLEGGRPLWSIEDFLHARINAGDVQCKHVLAFSIKHKLTLGSAASLLGGESSGSANMGNNIKKGTFKVAPDQSHANAVVSITDHCRDCGLLFATQAAFVSAVSKVVRVPEFNAMLFKHRVKLHGVGQIERRSGTEQYLDQIDALYNYQAKSTRLPLAFRARETARARQLPHRAKRGK